MKKSLALKILFLALALFTVHCSLFAQSQPLKRRCSGNAPSPAYATVALNTDGSVSITSCSGKSVTISGVANAAFQYGDGTASLPGVTFTSDTDTGLYRPAANTIGFTTNGTSIFKIDTAKFFPTTTATFDLGGASNFFRDGYLSRNLILGGSSSGSTTFQATAAASGTLTFPAATDTLIGKATTDTLTNKTFDTAGTGNSFSINGVAATANTGTGAVARAAGPTFTTPTLGVATGTSLAVSGLLTSSGPTAGIGYATGAGGAQTQATDKTTTVASNTLTTAVTLNSATLNAGTTVSFTFTNSSIAATDTVLCTHQSAGTSAAYSCNAFPGSGSAVISVRNNTAGNLSEAIVLRVTVIKSVSN